MIKVGFIDYYLDEWHANNYVHMLRDYSNGEVEAVYAWAEIDSPEDGPTTDAWCEKYGLTRMMTQEEPRRDGDGRQLPLCVLEDRGRVYVYGEEQCEHHDPPDDVERVACTDGQ